MPVTRADVIAHLKTIGFDVSMAQPLSQLKTLETKTAAFLLVLRYVLQLANKELAVSADQELAERIKATTAQLTFGHFLGKQVLSKIDVNTMRQEALNDVKNKHKGEYGYDVFVVVTDSVDKAKAVHETVQTLHDKHGPSLIQDLEALARETHKEIDEKQLTNPAFIAAKKTNGWLLPRQEIQKRTHSSDLTFLIREMIEQIFGKEFSNHMIGKKGETPLQSSKVLPNIIKDQNHYMIVYVVEAKPFDQLTQLASLLAQAEFQTKMQKKQKEMQLSIVKDLCAKNKQAVTLKDARGKEGPISEQVLNTLMQ